MNVEKMKKKIIVLEMGPLPEKLVPNYKQYQSLFEALLEDAELNFSSIKVYAGEALPEPDQADGFVISGSKHGVYEKLPWMLETEKFIRKAAKTHTPMIGICFGHQIMAEALGGRVEKSPKGWGLGATEYQVHPTNALPNLPSKMKLNAVHQDQIIIKPENAEVFASSDFCEFAGLVYGGKTPFAISLQPHPEFTKEFTTELINVRKGSVFPEALSETALFSQSESMDADKWGKALVDFLTAK